jgi:dTDP-4-dehydrorhamnose reductase
MSRILITGASGLLGLNTALEACAVHHVTGQVNSRPLHTTAFEVVQADLAAAGAVERLLDQTQPDWVIHCAALANLEACEANPALAQELNSEVPRKLAAHVAKSGARLLHVSTDAVFDGQKGDYTETDAPNPLSIYARTKLDGEDAVAAANPDAIIARVNLFGWSATGRRSLGEFFVNALSAGQPVKGFTDVIFCPLLATHLGGIFVEMLEKDLHGLYHVVSPDCQSKYDFGVAIARKFGFDDHLITPISWRDGGLAAARSPNLSLSIHKLLTALGHPIPTFSQALDQFYTHYQQSYPQLLRQMLV